MEHLANCCVLVPVCLPMCFCLPLLMISRSHCLTPPLSVCPSVRLTLSPPYLPLPPALSLSLCLLCLLCLLSRQRFALSPFPPPPYLPLSQCIAHVPMRNFQMVCALPPPTSTTMTGRGDDSQLVSVLLVMAYLEEGAKNTLPGGDRPDPLRSCALLFSLFFFFSGYNTRPSLRFSDFVHDHWRPQLRISSGGRGLVRRVFLRMGAM